MSDWYYAIDGQQHGPVSDRELHNLAGSGGLQPTDLVWQDGFGDWMPASTVSGLFRTGERPVPPAQPTGSNPFAETFVGSEAGVQGSVGRTPDSLKVPLLISAISSACFALLWFATCFLFFIGIPLGILAYYEIKLFQKADKIPVAQFAAEAKSLSLYQIIAGVLTGNVPSLVCGILLMIKGGEFESRSNLVA